MPVCDPTGPTHRTLAPCIIRAHWPCPPAPASRAGRSRAGAGSLRPPNTWVMPHDADLRTWPEPDPIASPEPALRHALGCLDGESAAVVLESALSLRLVDPTVAEEMLAMAPVRVRRRVGEVSTASESGSETRTVRALRRQGFPVHQQVYVEEIGFIDALAGGLLKTWELE